MWTGTRVRRLRSRLGVTQGELAKMLGRSSKVIVWRWENNKFSPNKTSRAKLEDLENDAIGRI